MKNSAATENVKMAGVREKEEKERVRGDLVLGIRVFVPILAVKKFKKN